VVDRDAPQRDQPGCGDREGVDVRELEEVGDELAAMILAIDPTALGELTYWGSFVEDVKDGNFSTQELQGERD